MPKKPNAQVLLTQVRKTKLPILGLRMLTNQPFWWVFLIAIFGISSAIILNVSFLIWPAPTQSLHITKPQIITATAGAQIKGATNSVTLPSPTPKPHPVTIIPQNSGRSVQVPILTYHYIGNNPTPADKARNDLSVAPDLFDAQMGYLAQNGYHPITLDTMYAGLKGNITLPPKPIILSFDDGYIDFYLNAFPILQKYNFHAVSFIPTGLMDQGYYLHWDQIRQMDASGLISFQAHSVNHPNLTALSDDQLKFQLAESKHKLEQELGKPVNFIAYPFGITDNRVEQAAQAVGYLGAVGTWGGEVESEGNLMDMPRIKISGSLSLASFPSRF